MGANAMTDLHGLDTARQVFFYEQDFYVLSNFSAFQVEIWGRRFMTSEHAYHCAKFLPAALAEVEAVMAATSAHEAFKIAQRNKDAIRADWAGRRVKIMKDILCAKAAQHEYVRRKLLATG